MHGGIERRQAAVIKARIDRKLCCGRWQKPRYEPRLFAGKSSELDCGHNSPLERGTSCAKPHYSGFLLSGKDLKFVVLQPTGM
ncbi:hypothetical protein [Brucella sp. 10RB9213]|uniref:hypothetical protein n=1 Tax=Brucella sp. 10RB9213 TaxID=1844039 RepID=UPI0013AD58E9|nr:hypothetical protein [Brucella sp. 10RB9213]MRN67960.1 hypothetical protein [Brucella sp. 10RB9213]